MDMRSLIDAGCNRVELRPLAAFGQLLPLLVEIPLLIIQRYIGTLRSCRMDDAVIELTYPAPSWASSYARYFECEVIFDKTRNALMIPAAWRDVANLGYDETTWLSSLRRCEHEDPTSAPSDILRRVHIELHTSLDADNPHAPLPTLEDIAAALHVSTRTIIRRLRTLETSYQQERDHVRQQHARHLLGSGSYRINEIATLLKFNDPTNFAKAFRRWFGESPTTYRDRVRTT
jgi:AraC-like DNA-binding protein